MTLFNGEQDPSEEELLDYYGDPKVLQDILAKGGECAEVCLCHVWCGKLNGEGCHLKKTGEEPEGGHCLNFSLRHRLAQDVERDVLLVLVIKTG